MKDTNNTRTEIDAAVEAGHDLARATQAVQRPEGFVPFVIGPHGVATSLENLLLRPLRLREKAAFPDVDSFTAYVNRWNQATGIIFAQQKAAKLTAILDYHADRETPSHCGHHAELILQPSEEWTAWSSRDRKDFGQVGFAEFLEEHSIDIREPESAAILEVVRNLKVTKAVSYEKAIDLTSGAVQFKYLEELETGKGKGSFVIPTQFTLGLRVYDHSEYYPVLARLRYRLQDDKLSFQFRLDRPDKIVETAFKDVLARIEKETHLKPLLGSVTTG